MIRDSDRLFDETFGFELSTQRNPDAIRRRDLGRQRFGRRYDGVEIGDESLASTTGSEVKPSVLGKLPESPGFENGFQFFTVHTRNSRGKGTGWLSLETYSTNSLHRVTEVFSSF